MIVQNENPTPQKPRRNYQGISLAGLALLVVGLLLARQLWHNQPGFPRQLELLLILSPVIVALGGVMLLMGLFRFLAGLGWFARLVSVQAGKRLQKAWRIFIWVLVAFSAWPYWWLDIVTRLNGERPGNEGEGMGGFMIMLFIGLPSLALAIFNEWCLRRNRSKQK